MRVMQDHQYVGYGGHMAIDKRISFLGGGNMAEALIKGMLLSGVVKPAVITATDISSIRLDHLKKSYGIIVQFDNRAAAENAEVVILCVKPQAMDRLMAEIAPVVDRTKLVISIAAGVTIERVEKALLKGPRVIRVMPNAPALVLAGAAALSPGSSATDADISVAQEIFGAIGRTLIVEERLMDAVTGLSGSGPAYVFTIIEALADAGVKAGLPRSTALELSAQTVLGAAKMVLETGEHPGRLRDMVTSPGGTTIAGIHELEKGGLRAVLMNAVEAATARSKDLGRQ